MSSTGIQQGTKAVLISEANGRFSARLYVNCPFPADGWQTPAVHGDATLVARKFKTLVGAKRWAAKTLGA